MGILRAGKSATRVATKLKATGSLKSKTIGATRTSSYEVKPAWQKSPHGETIAKIGKKTNVTRSRTFGLDTGAGWKAPTKTTTGGAYRTRTSGRSHVSKTSNITVGKHTSINAKHAGAAIGAGTVGTAGGVAGYRKLNHQGRVSFRTNG